MICITMTTYSIAAGFGGSGDMAGFGQFFKDNSGGGGGGSGGGHGYGGGGGGTQAAVFPNGSVTLVMCV